SAGDGARHEDRARRQHGEEVAVLAEVDEGVDGEGRQDPAGEEPGPAVEPDTAAESPAEAPQEDRQQDWQERAEPEDEGLGEPGRVPEPASGRVEHGGRPDGGLVELDARRDVALD